MSIHIVLLITLDIDPRRLLRVELSRALAPRAESGCIPSFCLCLNKTDNPRAPPPRLEPQRDPAAIAQPLPSEEGTTSELLKTFA